MVLSKFYESNFWVKFKTTGLLAMITVVLLSTLNSYLKYGKKDDPMSHWKKQVFLFLEVVDQTKDFAYLYSQPHNLVLALAFSLTINVPFLVNLFDTNVIKYRHPFHGKPLEIDEVELLMKTFQAHFG